MYAMKIIKFKVVKPYFQTDYGMFNIITLNIMVTKNSFDNSVTMFWNLGIFFWNTGLFFSTDKTRIND